MRRRGFITEIAAVAEMLTRPRYLRIVAEIAVHDRKVVLDGVRCPCCNSFDAEIVKRLPGADLIIDTHTGRRILEAETPAREWHKLAALARVHEVPIRCSPTTLPLLLDETKRHIFASGGNRASKTTTGLYWLALRLLRLGGRERRFWLVASTDEKAFRLLEKLFRVTPSPSGGVVPPILPGELVQRSPATHRASNLQTRLIDGSIVELRSFHGDPDAERAKGDPIVCALVDEAAHLPAARSSSAGGTPSCAWLAALRGRCVDLRGRLWLASTATVSSVVKPLVVDPAMEFERLLPDDPKKVSGAHEGAAWIFKPLPLMNNPWVSRENIEWDMNTLDMSKPENRRDFLGEFVASEGLCWTDFDTERHIVAHEARDVADLSPVFLARHGAAGHVPVTADAVRSLFGRTPNPHYRMARATNFRYLLGQDVNVNPMNTSVLQFTAPADKQGDREAWHVWVVDGVTSPHSNSLRHGERLVGPELSRIFDSRGAGLQGCGVICDATSLGKHDPHASRHGQSGSLAELYGRLGLDVRAPEYIPNKTGPGHRNGERARYFRLLHRLLAEGRLHVWSRCGALLNAFATQLVEPDGECPLDSRRGLWDVVMGPMDALRYAVWAAMNSQPSGAVTVGVLR